jgi:hypothetical protein
MARVATFLSTAWLTFVVFMAGLLLLLSIGAEPKYERPLIPLATLAASFVFATVLVSITQGHGGVSRFSLAMLLLGSTLLVACLYLFLLQAHTTSAPF